MTFPPGSASTSLLGAVVWALGAGLLAKQVVGDPWRDAVLDVRDQLEAPQ